MFALHFVLEASDKEFIKASRAVRLSFLLLEDALAELPQTEGTHKVLGVKLAIKSGDAAARDWLATAAAQGALPGVEVQRAEGSTVQLHEAAVDEGLQTVLYVKTEEEDREKVGGKVRREDEERKNSRDNNMEQEGY